MLILLLVFLTFASLHGKNIRVYSGKINVNTASSADLTRLPGIGEVLAFRIVKERERRGAFRHVAELKQIKGISSRIFEECKQYISIDGDTTLRSYLDVNSVTKALLLGIPNMSEGEADSILHYRQKAGSFTTIEDLLQVPGITQTRYGELTEWLVVAK
jgi:competence protein ComEA